MSWKAPRRLYMQRSCTASERGGVLVRQRVHAGIGHDAAGAIAHFKQHTNILNNAAMQAAIALAAAARSAPKSRQQHAVWPHHAPRERGVQRGRLVNGAVQDVVVS